jgi:hypothetical protein
VILRHLHPVMFSEKASPLFLGLDLSTQQLKAIVLAGDVSVVHESAVNFTNDLPQYGTINGAIIGPGPGEVTSISKSWKVGYNQVIGPPPRQGLIPNYMGL